MEKQRTIKKSVRVSGIQQSDGKHTYVEFKPYCGGVFVSYKNNIERVSLAILNNNEPRFTTSIIVNREIITMVEHVFSAVNGLGIDNVLIEFGSKEAPFFANSLHFAEKLKGELLTLDINKKIINIDRVIKIKGYEGQECIISPCKDFEVYTTINFDNIVGKQFFVYKRRKTDYLNEVAYARSMLIFPIKEGKDPWKHHRIQFKKLPKILPNNPSNSPFIAYDSKKFITSLKDPLEPARHKLLDFIGDLLFLQALPKGKFEIYRPGHSFNRQIVKKLYCKYKTKSKIGKDDTFLFFIKIMPELLTLKNVIENNTAHDESVYDHTRNVLNIAELLCTAHKTLLSENKKFIFLLSIMLHDYGKKDTIVMSGDMTTCNEHESVSEDIVKKNKILKRFKLSEKDELWILKFIRNHALVHKTLDGDDLFFKKSINKLKSEYPDMFVENLIFGIADIKNSCFAEHNKREYDRRIKLLKGEIKFYKNKKASTKNAKNTNCR